jgi:hypothetical protein
MLDFSDDIAAIEEGLKTASGVLREIELPGVGESSHFLEIKEQGEMVFQLKSTQTGVDSA